MARAGGTQQSGIAGRVAGIDILHAGNRLANGLDVAANGGGQIVMIGSVAGRTGGTALSTPIDYAASKGAVHVVIRWLSRNAVGRNLLINGIAPGPIETAMTAGSKVDATALPRGRMGQPEEMAWMIMMLLTPAASYVSGAVLDCNGGSYVG